MAGGRGFGGLTERPPAKPIIAAVEGYALAGGCELALACDLIVASEEAWFGLPEVTRGLVAGAGGLLRLHRRIPYHIAMEIALTGERVPAARLHNAGLINELVPAAGPWRRRASLPRGSRPTHRWRSLRPSESSRSPPTGRPLRRSPGRPRSRYPFSAPRTRWRVRPRSPRSGHPSGAVNDREEAARPLRPSRRLHQRSPRRIGPAAPSPTYGGVDVWNRGLPGADAIRRP